MTQSCSFVLPCHRAVNIPSLVDGRCCRVLAMHAESIGGCSPQIPFLLGWGVVKHAPTRFVYIMLMSWQFSHIPQFVSLRWACNGLALHLAYFDHSLRMMGCTVQRRKRSQAFGATSFALTVCQFKATNLPVGLHPHEAARNNSSC